MQAYGYPDRLSAVPGETIAFRVSCELPTYQADLVRLRRPFRTPDPAQDQVIPSRVNGEYRGMAQTTPVGSFVRVRETALLDGMPALTLQAWIQPTLVGRGSDQGIICRWDGERQSGFWLGINAEGLLTFRIGDGNGVGETTADAPLRDGWWHFVAATWDRASGTMRLTQVAQERRWLPAQGGTTTATTSVAVGEASGPLLFGASHLVESRHQLGMPAGCFNGKIDCPRVWRRALDEVEIAALRGLADPLRIDDGIVGAWDFSQGMSGHEAVDRGPNRLAGRVVNMPMRGVVGAHWDGTAVSLREAPEQYSAIAFHEDDLEDADWADSFSLTVPEGLESGIYAMRLMAGGGVDYVTFYVRRPVGDATAKVLFLAPTNTYLAYANERLFKAIDLDREFLEKTTGHDVAIGPMDEFLKAHPELGASVYDTHPDGSGICHSTRLRPLISMRPMFSSWHTQAFRHFAADLYLMQWLEQQGIACDVAIDEDLFRDGRALLDGYRVVMTGGHPEYWSTRMLDSLEAYLGSGGRMMYLGGNGFYWVTGQSEALPHMVEIRRGINGTRSWTSHPGEVYLSMTQELGGLWRNRGRTPNMLTGVGFAAEGWGGAPGYDQLPDREATAAQFVFAGIGPDEEIGAFGEVMGGAAGDEVDRYDLTLGTPPETLRLATSEGKHTDYYQLVIEDMNMTLPGRGGTEDSRVRSDVTLLESENGGSVFSVGSINWIGSLMTNGGDNNVSRMTANVLRRFGELEEK